jgi:predicted phage tail protein
MPEILDPILLAGGGGGGGTEAPNTLRSRDYLKIMMLVCEGSVVGPPSGDILKDFYVDDTPIKNPDGNFNFTAGDVQYTQGTQNQLPIPGFGTIEADQQVEVEIPNSRPVVRQFTNTLDSVRIRLVAPEFRKIESNGDVNPTSVEYKIELSTNFGAFITIIQRTETGKSAGFYAWNHVIPLPGGTATWQIRITRITANPPLTGTGDKNKIFWQSYTSIRSSRLRYPNSSLVALSVSAEYFKQSPKVAVMWQGKNDLRIPSNYNPVTRAYTGIWDGTFSIGYTNNPAWVYYDLITSERYGAGRYIKAANVDKWSLYKIAKYCDELVDDGKLGLEPRFTCNVYIRSQEDAFKVINNLSSVFRGMSYWAAGQVFVVQDAPGNVTAVSSSTDTNGPRIYTEANTVCEYDESGKMTSAPFNYKSTDLAVRHTAAIVSWIDPNDYGKNKLESVLDDANILKYGYRPTELEAYGCTSAGQAKRTAKWVLATEQLEKETVSFRVGAEGALIRPGEIIKIADSTRLRKRIGGRVIAATSSSITFDAPVELLAGQAYNISIVTDLGIQQLIHQFTSSSSTSLTTLGYGTNISVVPDPGTIWLLAGDVVSQLWRVLAISEADGIFTVTCTAHAPSKYAIADDTGTLNIATPVRPFPTIPDAPGVVRVEIRTQFVTVVWEPATSFGIKEYRVEYQLNGGLWVWADTTSYNDLDIALPAGNYLVRVRSVDMLDRYSSYVMSGGFTVV